MTRQAKKNVVEWERKKGTEGQRRSPRELAGVSFDGWALTLSSWGAVDPAYPEPGVLRCVSTVPDCHLNQRPGGFENGPPTRGAQSDLAGPYN